MNDFENMSINSVEYAMTMLEDFWSGRWDATSSYEEWRKNNED